MNVALYTTFGTLTSLGGFLGMEGEGLPASGR